MASSILVTGGAGFIGTHVVAELVADGHDVKVLDGLVEQVHGASAPPRLGDDVEVVVADVRDRDALSGALVGVEGVVHLAAEVGVGQSMYEIARYVGANSLGTATLLDVLANDRTDVARLVVASSMSVYGEGSYACGEHGTVHPTVRAVAQLAAREWEVRCPVCEAPVAPVPTSEDNPARPTSVYAITKLDQELLCLTTGAAYGIGTVALRYFNTYGPGQALSNPYTGVGAIFSSRLLNGKAPLAFEDGLQRRDFVHVADVARATVAALGATAVSGESINVGTGEPHTILEVAERLAEALGVERRAEVTGRYRAGDVRHCYADTAKAERLLGCTPTVAFRDGVADLVEWVRTQDAVDGVDGAYAELGRRGLAH